MKASISDRIIEADGRIMRIERILETEADPEVRGRLMDRLAAWTTHKHVLINARSSRPIAMSYGDQDI